MYKQDTFVRGYGAETGAISISQANYHGSALAGVDRQIRLSNNGRHHEMMEVEAPNTVVGPTGH